MMEETNKTDLKLSLGLRILLTVAGLFTASLITSFLTLVLTEKALFPLGIIALGVSIAASRETSPTTQFSVTYPAYITAFICVVIGFNMVCDNKELVVAFLTVMAVVSAFAAGTKELRQLALFSFFGLLCFIVPEESAEFVTCPLFALFYIIVYAATGFYNDKLKELPFLGESLPVIRFSSLLFAMVKTSEMINDNSYNEANVSSYRALGVIFALMVCALGVYLLYRHLKDNNSSFYMGVALVVVFAGLTAVDAQIALAILALFLAFSMSARREFILSILYMLCALISFYYNTEMLLLYKSISLMISGVVFLLMYYFLKRSCK